ncbi:DUF6273 domain-containing protein [Megamonas funiformis]|uniref:DUF6273 domain-containing protein n=1 Tax=Megamonas funiformis TaxID=437897 RepID=UPI003F82AA30
MYKLTKAKKIISLLLCMAIMIGILPKQVFAEDYGNIELENFGVNNPTYENQVATFDCVWFGNYMQSGDDEYTIEPIKWRVLSVNGNKALLLADKNLDNKRFNDWWNWGVSWENSTLREWMNSDFKDIAFGENVKNALCIHEETEDEVFALSLPEIKAMNDILREYGFDDEAIKKVWRSSNTNYLSKKLEKEGIEAPNTGWWLRSNGMFNFLACHITEDGGKDERNIDERDERGRTMARPSVYLDLSQTESWSYAGTISSDGKVNEIKKETDENIEEYFSGERDGWPFANSEAGLGVDKDWHHYQLKTWLSKAGLDSLTSMVTLQWLWSYVPFVGWQGDCFGLSLSSAAIYSNKYDASKLFLNTYEESKTLNRYGYQSIKKTQDVFQFNYYTLEGNEEALQFIEGLQLLQSSKEFNDNYEVFKDESLDAIIHYFNDSSDKRVILVAMDCGSKHAVIIDKSKPALDLHDGLYRIPLYDCNYPSDSQGLLDNSDDKDYRYKSYMVIKPETNEYMYEVYDGTDYKYDESTQYYTKKDTPLFGAKFYDVSNVDSKFFADHAEDLYREILLDTVFMSCKNTFTLYDAAYNKIVEIQNGVLKNYDENLCELNQYIGDNNDTDNKTSYILRLDDYNNKNIVIEDGTFFIMRENAIYCVNVDGKIELKLDTENTAIKTKSLQDGSIVSINLQSDLSTNYKTIDAEIVLDNDEELTIQNKEGSLTIDSPKDKKGNVQLDNAGKIEKKTDTLLKDLNGYNIGTGKQENTSNSTDADDKKDTKDNADIDNRKNSITNGNAKSSTDKNNKLSAVNNKDSATGTTKENPDTGDYQNITLLILVLVISIFIMGIWGVCVTFKKRKKK